jgi:hypothetical protein
MTEFLSSLDKASLEKLCGKKVLVTGSSGHLGEALCRTLHAQSSALSLQCQVVSLDILPSEFTTHVGSILDREVVKEVLQGVDVVFHTATLHKPHIVSHTNQDFVDINVTGTLNLLEESLISGVKAFIFTSSTTVFGDAMKSANPVWVTENLNPIPKNIYGVTKLAAEMLDMFTDKNIKCQEYLYRRVDIQDAVDAHLLAALKCKEIGFDKYIISASTKFSIGDAESLQNNADEVLLQHCPDYLAIYQKLGWKMFTRFDRGMLSGRANRKILQ